MYFDDREAQKELAFKFDKLMGTTALTERDAYESGDESPKKAVRSPARQRPTLDLSNLKGNEDSVFQAYKLALLCDKTETTFPTNQHLKKLRCRPTYTSPPPPPHRQPIRNQRREVPVMCTKTHRALVIARQLGNLASATLRINQRKNLSVPADRNRRPSSAPVLGSDHGEVDLKNLTTLLMSNSAPDLKSLADVEKILEDLEKAAAEKREHNSELLLPQAEHKSGL